MHRTYLLLGSNLGDRRNSLRSALQGLAQLGVVKSKSSVYRSAAWGNTAQPDFLNMTVELQTPLSPRELLAAILDLEVTMGRKRTEKWGSRLIDIDILFYEDIIVTEAKLVIPHPQIQNRRFTLVPMAEIAEAFIHPMLKKTIGELLQACPDPLEVQREANLDESTND